MWIPAITWAKAIESCRCPAIVTRESGRARESPTSTILVVNLLRDQPGASRLASEFLSFDGSLVWAAGGV
jgi:hypothetical protein